MSSESTVATAGNLAQLPTRPLLIVCDIPHDIADFKKHLGRDYRLHFAHTQAQALAYVDRYKPAVALLDLALGRGTSTEPEGFLTMAALLRYAPALKIIVVTENTQRADAVRSVGAGAYDFYHKPIEGQILRIITNRASRWEELEQENRSLALQAQQAPDSGLIGTCAGIQQVHKAIETWAVGDDPVLITGASGTGKKLVARALHSLGPRQSQRFLAIDCKTCPQHAWLEELPFLTSEAPNNSKGRKRKSEQGQGGTILLEEIGQLAPALQERLLSYLRACQAGNRPEVRLLCSASDDLAELAAQQVFNSDLLDLLKHACIDLPALKDRGDDRLLLARAFLHKFNAEYHQSRQGFTTEALDAIVNYAWPGNVPELAQKIKRAVLMAHTPLLGTEDLHLAPLPGQTSPRTLQQARREAEMQALQQALAVSNGNLSAAAKILAISRPTLYDLLKRHGLKNSD